MTLGLTVVTGGGGFIGGHLVAALRAEGRHVRAVDIAPVSEWHQRFDDVENVVCDLKLLDNARNACRGASTVFQLASEMGGIGFIERNKARCMLSVLIDTHMLQAAREFDVKRFFYASSACVYAADKQASPDVTPLREDDVYPAMPEDGYGWQKLFSERMCRHFREDFGLATRVARFHNVYGPFGTWKGGREKAPAAMCRKVLEAVHTGTGEIEIWGNGQQTRSFMYIDDCVKGTLALVESDFTDPVNIGSNELVTINMLADIAESIAGVRLRRRYVLDAPKGVNGRNSDNTRVREVLGWEPSVRLREGMERTYAWVEREYLRGARS